MYSTRCHQSQYRGRWPAQCGASEAASGATWSRPGLLHQSGLPFSLKSFLFCFVLRPTRQFDLLDIGSSLLPDGGPIPGRDQLFINQVAANSKRHSPIFNEFGGVLKADSAGWNQFKERERLAQIFEISRAKSPGGKDLDGAGPGVPGVQDFSGRESARHDSNSGIGADLNSLKIRDRRDHKLSA